MNSSLLKNDKKAIDALTSARTKYNSVTAAGLKEQQRLQRDLANAQEKQILKLKERNLLIAYANKLLMRY